MDLSFESRAARTGRGIAVKRREQSLGAYGAVVALVVLAVLPWVLQALDADYYLGFARRVLIISLAVVSLNLLIGYGGLVALGHAGFMGAGAYTVAALTHAGHLSGWLILAIVVVVSAVLSAVIGLVSLRTRGVYFIMVSMACAQLLYYLAIALRVYGSEDGYTLPEPLQFGFGWTTADESIYYLIVLGIAAVSFAGLSHLLNSRFGIALRAVRENEQRMVALGFPVRTIQLWAFIVAGTLAGLAGALLIGHNGFVTPSLLNWSQSANLVVMLVLGGIGYRWGGVVGATVWLVLEEVLRQMTTHWHWPLGLILIGIVLIAPRGLCSLLPKAFVEKQHG
ncbi:branched-chain amino acid ABC transporter permease [Pigmentiphaga kullae]|uniref:Branched-chain amino acid transport system permease protein n=1 Tax=Pigmentiphaga kullae TaxID=151784 RepID=A0A4Q7NNE2_9BURK|nr:branched-chain amino acid ABC transporter permease [Pigmentiphaga kullae]RZS86592.1 branched-chain amino acid transport system permease protein [Pigmentiphaga kullae]